jgi:hypothetical protein
MAGLPPPDILQGLLPEQRTFSPAQWRLVKRLVSEAISINIAAARNPSEIRDVRIATLKLTSVESIMRQVERGTEWSWEEQPPRRN